MIADIAVIAGIGLIRRAANKAEIHKAMQEADKENSARQRGQQAVSGLNADC